MVPCHSRCTLGRGGGTVGQRYNLKQPTRNPTELRLLPTGSHCPCSIFTIHSDSLLKNMSILSSANRRTPKYGSQIKQVSVNVHPHALTHLNPPSRLWVSLFYSQENKSLGKHLNSTSPEAASEMTTETSVHLGRDLGWTVVAVGSGAGRGDAEGLCHQQGHHC